MRLIYKNLKLFFCESLMQLQADVIIDLREVHCVEIQRKDNF